MDGIGGNVCWSEMWSEEADLVMSQFLGNGEGVGNSLWGGGVDALYSSEQESSIFGMKQQHVVFVDNYWMMEDNNKVVDVDNDHDVAIQDDKLLPDHQSKKRSAAAMNKRSSRGNKRAKTGETSMSWCSEEDSATRTRARAGRGSATDPQSLYARKRRERINERLRILQKLVPNGTKVDISTMLEEAVQYVKFLQLQIKLLSSDDTWMYAPLAYNGMDIGLLDNINTPTPTLKPHSH